jgi:hypothetical protein
VRLLREGISVLKRENQDLKQSRPCSIDYEGQMKRLKDSYEQRVLGVDEQLNDFKAKLKKQRNGARHWRL